jgi:hypothetical protein
MCYSNIELQYTLWENWCEIFDFDFELIHIEITHYNEMNDQIFNIDIDMNIWDIARNVM